MSKETKEKISKSNTGKKRSEETCKKLSKIFSGENNPHYGKPRPLKTRKKIAEKNYKPIKVYIYKTHKFVGEYTSSKECAEKLNICAKNISPVLYGKRKQHKGYTFEFINKKDEKT